MMYASQQNSCLQIAEMLVDRAKSGERNMATFKVPCYNVLLHLLEDFTSYNDPRQILVLKGDFYGGKV